jgi:hypothetical protein
MENRLALHEHELPSGFPSAKILNQLDIIMYNNEFTFGNCCWKQQKGTALRMSCACAYDVTIYCSYHEETSLIVLANLHGILFYCQLIHNALIPQHNNPGAHDIFLAAMNLFGKPGTDLEWESSGPSQKQGHLS